MIKNIIILALVGIIGYSYLTGMNTKTVIEQIEKTAQKYDVQIQSPVLVGDT